MSDTRTPDDSERQGNVVGSEANGDLESFWKKELDRRNFVKRSLLGAFGVAGAGTVLAACGGTMTTRLRPHPLPNRRPPCAGAAA